MNTEINIVIAEILELAAADKEVCEKANDMLKDYATKLLAKGKDGICDIDELASEYAEPPVYNCDIIEQWDGSDPDIGLANCSSIYQAMAMCIYERNYELLTNDYVQCYWDELSESVCPDIQNQETVA